MTIAASSGTISIKYSTRVGLRELRTACSSRLMARFLHIIHPLRILDFDPLPPQMPLIAGIIQAWQPLAAKYVRVRCLGDQRNAMAKSKHWKTNGTILFRVATVGWSPVPTAKRSPVEQVLDRQEQIIEWQQFGPTLVRIRGESNRVWEVHLKDTAQTSAANQFSSS